MIHLDTHVALWLQGGEAQRLTSLGRRLLEEEDVVLSPLVLVEVSLLAERGRVATSADDVLAGLAGRLDARTSTAALTDVCLRAHLTPWTRDPFDRLLLANARADGARLLTKDRVLREHAEDAVW